MNVRINKSSKCQLSLNWALGHLQWLLALQTWHGGRPKTGDSPELNKFSNQPSVDGIRGHIFVGIHVEGTTVPQYPDPVK